MKLLFLDIETAPIVAHVWKLWENNVGLNQIVKDWHLLSWCAKWQGSSEIIYRDQRDESDISNDKKLCQEMWKLLDEADVIATQNGKKFDAKKLNARFIINGIKPPSPYQHVDTKQIASRKFAFTSNSLEYMAKALKLKHQKLKHKKFAGHELWIECLAKNPEAWKEMEKYNKHDVLSLEDLYDKLIAWDTTFNPNVFNESLTTTCTCGSTRFTKNGNRYTARGKYQRLICIKCGKPWLEPINLFEAMKKLTLRNPTG